MILNLSVICHLDVDYLDYSVYDRIIPSPFYGLLSIDPIP